MAFNQTSPSFYPTQQFAAAASEVHHDGSSRHPCLQSAPTVAFTQAAPVSFSAHKLMALSEAHDDDRSQNQGLRHAQTPTPIASNHCASPYDASPQHDLRRMSSELTPSPSVSFPEYEGMRSRAQTLTHPGEPQEYSRHAPPCFPVRPGVAHSTASSHCSSFPSAPSPSSYHGDPNASSGASSIHPMVRTMPTSSHSPSRVAHRPKVTFQKHPTTPVPTTYAPAPTSSRAPAHEINPQLPCPQYPVALSRPRPSARTSAPFARSTPRVASSQAQSRAPPQAVDRRPAPVPALCQDQGSAHAPYHARASTTYGRPGPSSSGSSVPVTAPSSRYSPYRGPAQSSQPLAPSVSSPDLPPPVAAQAAPAPAPSPTSVSDSDTRRYVDPRTGETVRVLQWCQGMVERAVAAARRQEREIFSRRRFELLMSKWRAESINRRAEEEERKRMEAERFEAARRATLALVRARARKEKSPWRMVNGCVHRYNDSTMESRVNGRLWGALLRMRRATNVRADDIVRRERPSGIWQAACT